MNSEQRRLDEAREQAVPWKKWGPYLSERQWGTVREDYSENGNAWDNLRHDQARGYLYFLGDATKQEILPEEKPPLFGWPAKRIKGWRKNVWVCPWLGQASDLLEPYFFLPSLLILAWLFVLLQHCLTLGTRILLGLASVLVATMLFVFCFLWVRAQEKYEKEP